MAQRHPTSQQRPDPKTKGEEPDDVFVAKVFEASTWAQQNRLTLIILGVVVAVLAVGAYSYVDYRARLNEQALVQLEQIQQSVSMGDVEQGKAELTQYLSRFEGTPSAAEARLLLADLYLRSDQPGQAIDVLEESDVRTREPLGVQLATLKAKAHEVAGDIERAEETYLEVAEAAELDFQVTEALSDAARLRERQEDWAGAAELYERILDSMEEGDENIGVYRMRLAEARTAAQRGSDR